jgi:hypothetical protein
MKGKEIRFWIEQMSAEECENKGINTIKGGILRGRDRKTESVGDEMDSQAVVVKR